MSRSARSTRRSAVLATVLAVGATLVLSAGSAHAAPKLSGGSLSGGSLSGGSLSGGSLSGGSLSGGSLSGGSLSGGSLS